jgi:pyruvate dehydrogenase E2 component (dihydrolipoamide acetyltransferase)
VVKEIKVALGDKVKEGSVVVMLETADAPPHLPPQQPCPAAAPVAAAVAAARGCCRGRRAAHRPPWT